MALARHGEAVATVRSFAEGTGAERVVVLVDRGETAALMVDLTHPGDIEITDEDSVAVIAADALVPAEPKALPSLRATPASAITVDPDTAELSAPIGTVQHLAEAVRALAGAFGGRSVATAEFATRDRGLPITIAAREGEPPVLSAGGEEFELPL
jgi:hypothetical protein